jgi:peptidoglycan lytic transglycosylase
VSTRPSSRQRPATAQECAAAIFPPKGRNKRQSPTNAASHGTYWSAEAYLPGQTVSECPLHHFLLILLCFFALAFEARAEIGLASYYSYGNRGEPGEMTCAHRTRSFGSLVTVTYSGRSIQCRIADRGPFIRGRIIDLSVKAARALGMMEAGVVRVSVE